MQLKHIIFDCDGVLVDSEPLSMRADVALLKTLGISITEHEAHARFVGKTFEAMLDEMAIESGKTFPPGLSAEKDAMLEDLFRSDLQIVPGTQQAIIALKARGLTFSVASNSPKKRVALALELTGIAQHFTAITTFEEVKQGKPAPDVFLRAVEKTGLPAANCLIIEDSTTGVTAAVAAGVRTLGFTGTHPHPDEQGKKLLTLGASRTLLNMASLPELV